MKNITKAGQGRMIAVHYPAGKIFFLLSLIVMAYGLGLLSASHPLRASLVKVVEVTPETLSKSPAELKDLIRFEDEALLAQFSSLVPLRLRRSGQQSPAELMYWLDDFARPHRHVKKTWLPEAPDRLVNTLVTEGKRGSCYNDSVMLGTFVQSTAGKARYVSFNSADGLGGKGHTVTEIWVPGLMKWVLFDQQQVALFTDAATGVPMSALEIRERVLTQNREAFLDSVEIAQGEGYVLHKDEIWNLYQSSNELIVLGSADYFSRNQKYVVNMIADWTEATLEPYGRMLLLGRLIRAAFGEAPRLRLVDEFTPSITYDFWYYTLRILVSIWLLSLFLYALSKIPDKYRIGAGFRRNNYLKNPQSK